MGLRINIPKEKLPEMLNKGVHVSWAKNGCWWHLKDFNDEYAILETPSSGRIVKAKIETLQYIKKHEPKILETTKNEG